MNAAPTMYAILVDMSALGRPAELVHIGDAHGIRADFDKPKLSGETAAGAYADSLIYVAM